MLVRSIGLLAMMSVAAPLPTVPTVPNKPIQPQVGKPLGPTPQLSKEASCAGTVTIRPTTIVNFWMGLARGDNDPGDSTRGLLTAQARVTKRGIIVDVEGSYAEGRGDTLFRALAQTSASLYLQKPGCEIASVSLDSGRLVVPAKGDESIEIEGTGLIESVRCTPKPRRDVQACSHLKFRSITVHLRPLVVDCSDLELAIPSLSAWNYSASGRYYHAPIDSVIPNEYGIELGRGTRSVSIRGHASKHYDREEANLGVRVSIISSWEEEGRRSTSLRAYSGYHLIDVERDRPGCKIDGVTPESGGYGGETKNNPEHRARSYGMAGSENVGTSTGNFRGAHCVTDTDGRDGSRVGCADLRFDPITVQLSPAD